MLSIDEWTLRESRRRDIALWDLGFNGTERAVLIGTRRESPQEWNERVLDPARSGKLAPLGAVPPASAPTIRINMEVGRCMGQADVQKLEGACRFFAGLSIQDQPIKVQREYLAQVRAMGEALGRWKGGK